MNVTPINSNQSFQALNFSNVSTADRIFIRKDFKKLQELGEKYNIRLTSSYAGVPNFSAIDVDVRPLKQNLSFWKRLFPPTGRSTFTTNENSILDSVRNAIKDLAVKTGK